MPTRMAFCFSQDVHTNDNTNAMDDDGSEEDEYLDEVDSIEEDRRTDAGVFRRRREVQNGRCDDDDRRRRHRRRDEHDDKRNDDNDDDDDAPLTQATRSLLARMAIDRVSSFDHRSSSGAARKEGGGTGTASSSSDHVAAAPSSSLPMRVSSPIEERRSRRRIADDEANPSGGGDGKSAVLLDSINRIKAISSHSLMTSSTKPQQQQQQRRRHRPARTRGPNERTYRDRYDGYVSSILRRDPRRGDSGGDDGGDDNWPLQQWKRMSAAEQVKSMRVVDDLLRNLGVPGVRSGGVSQTNAAGTAAEAEAREGSTAMAMHAAGDDDDADATTLQQQPERSRLPLETNVANEPSPADDQSDDASVTRLEEEENDDEEEEAMEDDVVDKKKNGGTAGNGAEVGGDGGDDEDEKALFHTQGVALGNVEDGEGGDDENDGTVTFDYGNGDASSLLLSPVLLPESQAVPAPAPGAAATNGRSLTSANATGEGQSRRNKREDEGLRSRGPAAESLDGDARGSRAPSERADYSSRRRHPAADAPDASLRHDGANVAAAAAAEDAHSDASSVELARRGHNDHDGRSSLLLSPRHRRMRRYDVVQSPSLDLGGGSPEIDAACCDNRKRLATTSGKRGTDLQRQRLGCSDDNEEDEFPPPSSFDGNDDHFLLDGGAYGTSSSSSQRRRGGLSSPGESVDSPSPMMCSSIRSPSAVSHLMNGTTPSPEMGGMGSISLDGGNGSGEGGHDGCRLKDSRVVGKQSLSPSFLAGASQSPIAHRDEESGNEDGAEDQYRGSPDLSPRRAIRFGRHPTEEAGDRRRFARGSANEKAMLHDTVDTVNCTVLPRRARERGSDAARVYAEDPSFFRAPADIRLRDGVHFRYDPLRVRRPAPQRGGGGGQRKNQGDVIDGGRKKRSSSLDSRDGRVRRPSGVSPALTLSFPDPLSFFPTRMAERLSVVSEWLAYRDDAESEAEVTLRQPSDLDDGGKDDNVDENKSIGGVVISIPMAQVVGVTLKLLVEKKARARRFHQGRQRSLSTTKAKVILAGGTLIVVRAKEDIANYWETALRERTSFSVMNHASLSSTERKLDKTLTRSAGFDVVLTTFDALKAREATTPVDGGGRAMLRKSDVDQDGWFTSRSSGMDGSQPPAQPQKCEKLSLLHSLEWFRVIFVDELGRKSYVAKAGTARSTASIAINARSRFVFFAKPTDATGILEKKLKDDRKQLCAIAATLHLSEDGVGERIVGDAMLDLKDVREDINCADETFIEGDSSHYYQDSDGASELEECH